VIDMVKLTGKQDAKLKSLLRSRPDYDELFFGAQDISPALDRKLSKRGAFSAKRAEKEGVSQFDFLKNWLEGLLKW